MTFSGARRSPFVPTQAYYAAADDAGDDAYYYAAAGDDVRRPRARYRLFFETPTWRLSGLFSEGPTVDRTVSVHGPVALSLLTRPGAVEEDVGSPPLFTVGSPAQAPAYYYYTAADDSTYGYDDSAYAYGSDDAYGHAQCLKSMVAARCATAESRPPRHRRDASSMAWRRGLSPLDAASTVDSLVDLRTGLGRDE